MPWSGARVLWKYQCKRSNIWLLYLILIKSVCANFVPKHFHPLTWDYWHDIISTEGNLHTTFRACLWARIVDPCIFASPRKHTKKSAEKPVDTGISAWYNDSARGKNPELIFVRVLRDTVSFLTMHTWLFLYAAMMQNIITISKINLRDKCFFSLQRKFHGWLRAIKVCQSRMASYFRATVSK